MGERTGRASPDGTGRLGDSGARPSIRRSQGPASGESAGAPGETCGVPLLQHTGAAKWRSAKLRPCACSPCSWPCSRWPAAARTTTPSAAAAAGRRRHPASSTAAATRSRPTSPSSAARRWWSTSGPPGAGPAGRSSPSSRARRRSARARWCSSASTPTTTTATPPDSSTTTRCPFQHFKDPDLEVAASFNGGAGLPDHGLLRLEGRARVRAPGRLRERGASSPRTSTATLADVWTSGPYRADEELSAALELRERVFCGEQGVSIAADRDGRDHEATHIVAVDGGRVVGHLPAAVPRPRWRAWGGWRWSRRARPRACGRDPARGRPGGGGARARAHRAARPDLRARPLPRRTATRSAARASSRRASSTWRWRSAL